MFSRSQVKNMDYILPKQENFLWNLYLNLCLTIQIITQHVESSTIKPTCGPGQYLDTYPVDRYVCTSCPLGSFMDEDKHQNEACYPCYKPEQFLHEYAMSACTPTSDTVISCGDGYYKSHSTVPRARLVECKLCRDCGKLGMQTSKICGPTTDAVCCPKPEISDIYKWDDYMCL